MVDRLRGAARYRLGKSDVVWRKAPPGFARRREHQRAEYPAACRHRNRHVSRGRQRVEQRQMRVIPGNGAKKCLIDGVDDLCLPGPKRNRDRKGGWRNIWRIAAQQVGERRLSGVAMRRAAPVHRSVIGDQPDRREISDRRDGKAHDIRQRHFVLQRRIEQRARLGEKFPSASRTLGAPRRLLAGTHRSETLLSAVERCARSGAVPRDCRMVMRVSPWVCAARGSDGNSGRVLVGHSTASM